MPGIPDPMTRVGVTNSDWGVCGFTSSLYALYDLNPAARPQIINATAAYHILAEIKTYLMLLKAENSGLLQEITDFTRSFGGKFANFSVDAYVAHVNSAAADGLSRKQILSDPLYSIALPPAAVADYIKRIWGWNSTITSSATGSGNGDGIIGVTPLKRDAFFGKTAYHGLRHYMYRRGTTIYSWGKSFNSVQQAADEGARGVKWRVCYVISATRP